MENEHLVIKYSEDIASSSKSILELSDEFDSKCLNIGEHLIKIGSSKTVRLSTARNLSFALKAVEHSLKDCIAKAMHVTEIGNNDLSETRDWRDDGNYL